MHNPVTGSGGMLTGTVDEVGPDSPLGLKPGERVATLVSLTLTPLEITDGLARWDGLSEQIPCEGHAILFARSIAAVLPADLPVPLALAVMDVCGAPALTRRVVRGARCASGPVVIWARPARAAPCPPPPPARPAPPRSSASSRTREKPPCCAGQRPRGASPAPGRRPALGLARAAPRPPR